MPLPRIATREDFVEYIMKTLGHPMITVNVTEDQVDYRIDDALIKFFEFHDEGTYRAYLLHEYSQEDKDRGYITLPHQVHSVTKIWPSDGQFMDSRNFATLSWAQNMGRMMFGSISGGAIGTGNLPTGMFPSMGNGALSMNSFNYGLAANNVHVQSYAGTVTGSVTGQNQFQYSRFGNRLYIDDRNPNVEIGEKILVECFVTVDEDEQSIWDDIWLRDYTVSLVKKQWGQNLIKFGNTQLANGTTINGEVILNEANRELEKLEEDLLNKWSEPLGVLVG